jgi:hypothetical protein
MLLGLEEENQELQVLNASDISTANVFNEERSLGRGYEANDISWIWRMRGIGAEQRGNNWLDDGMYNYSFNPTFLLISC